MTYLPIQPPVPDSCHFLPSTLHWLLLPEKNLLQLPEYTMFFYCLALTYAAPSAWNTLFFLVIPIPFFRLFHEALLDPHSLHQMSHPHTMCSHSRLALCLLVDNVLPTTFSSWADHTSQSPSQLTVVIWVLGNEVCIRVTCSTSVKRNCIFPIVCLFLHTWLKGENSLALE